MTFHGFTLRNIYLEAERKRFDLRNSFDYRGYFYDGPERRLSLSWYPTQYAVARGGRRISIDFYGVSHASMEPDDGTLSCTQDDYLSFIGYILPASKAGEAKLLDKPTLGMHVVFCFRSQARLRIYAGDARVAFGTCA